MNDRYGHDIGDALLVQVAKRLQAGVRADDMVSRFGGDEFVILLRDTTPAEVDVINRRIVAAIPRPFRIADVMVSVGLTTGAADPDNDTRPEAVISRADRAMYAQKNRRTPSGIPSAS